MASVSLALYNYYKLVTVLENPEPHESSQMISFQGEEVRADST